MAFVKFRKSTGFYKSQGIQTNDTFKNSSKKSKNEYFKPF